MGMLLVVILVFSSHSQTIFPSAAKNALGTRLSLPDVMLVLEGKHKLGQHTVLEPDPFTSWTSLDPRPNPRGRVWGKTLPGSVLSAGMLP